MNFRQEKTVLGIELGTTRIKAVLLSENFLTLSSGEWNWENRYENGYWTYAESEIENGLRKCYANLKQNYFAKYGRALTTVGAIGVSSMMHGYLPLDKNNCLPAAFRTWRNNNASDAAQKLTKLFHYNIPARWSVAHLYQSILSQEEHVKDIAHLTTLGGYIHMKLTGEKVIGIGDASGMFPIDFEKKCYDETAVKLFEDLPDLKKLPWRIKDILPKILLAGERAGSLTKAGAAFLDPQGDLKEGVPFCPPEGDAETGMVATNSIKKKSANVSAGTSIFGTVVLNGKPKSVHTEIDLVATPTGEPAAMAHCNNCTSELNAWVSVFEEFLSQFGLTADRDELFSKLFAAADKGDPDCGGLLACNYISGENITRVAEGRPMLLRRGQDKLTLNNLMRSQLYAALATLKIGFDLLKNAEGVEIESVCGHGGIFKTEGVFQSYLASALKAPVSLMRTAGGGGPWGMAVLAAFMLKRERDLAEFLENQVFGGCEKITVIPDPETAEGIDQFTENFVKILPVIRSASDALKKV